ncbi:MAG: XRE family transcriptional regulator [Burkholderiaceae bacterium]
MYMSKPSTSSQSLPAQVESALVKLGADLRIARLRRGESLRSWALRMHVSVPTIQRMENGDPKVGMSAYATAIWLAGKIKQMEMLVDPKLDEHALSMEIVRAERKGKAHL